jgi:hypothetical protein
MVLELSLVAALLSAVLGWKCSKVKASPSSASCTQTAAAAFPGQEDEEAEPRFDKLPTALLIRILQALPQRERLANCATVCSSWAAAAAAATVEVHVSDVHGTEAQAFQPWLQQHAGQLVSLRGTGRGFGGSSGCPEMRLPCGQLQQLLRLDFSGLGLQLDNTSSSNSSNPGAAVTMLPRLQHLKLQDCKLARNIFTQLAQLSGVTRLKLLGYSRRPLRQENVKLMLQGLPNLAHLSLAYVDCFEVGTAVSGFSAVAATSLTALTLEHVFELDIPYLEDTYMPCTWHENLSRLVGLQKLKLTQTSISPEALASLSRLTRLQLFECRVTHHQRPAHTAALLPAIGSMHQLQHLALQGVDTLLQTDKPADCAALTASSQLTHLWICSSNWQPLTRAAVPHMFPAGRQLPQLQQLVLSGAESDCEEALLSIGCFTTANLHSIVSACPALRRLDISGVLAIGSDVSALLQLPSTCASLTLGGISLSPHSVSEKAAGVVAQLTQLTFLEWRKCPGKYPGLTDAALQLLTALELLQTFRMQGLDRSCSCVVPGEPLGHPIGSKVFQLTAGDKVRHWKAARQLVHTAVR